MDSLTYSLRKLLSGVPLILGVTFISFILMVYLGPDQTYSLLGKNPTQADMDNIRHQLGYDQSLGRRYGQYLLEMASFDFGYSTSSNERVASIFARTLPVSLGVGVPGFVLGNLLGIILAMWAVYHRGAWQDKLIMVGSVSGMSISLLIVIIALQYLLCSSFGLDLFPVQGWEVDSLASYLRYVTVPTLATTFVALGYNTRFYRAVLAEEMGRDHVRTARAFGCHPSVLIPKHVLRNGLVPILTRMMFTLPFVLIGGSLLIESFFSIPGIGGVTFDAITSGDLPILKAVVSCSTLLYVGVVIATDIIYKFVDPRIQL